MRAKEGRTIGLYTKVSPEEKAVIDKKMELLGTTNLRAYLRKQAVDGYVVHADMSGIVEAVKLLRSISNNQLLLRPCQIVPAGPEICLRERRGFFRGMFRWEGFLWKRFRSLRRRFAGQFRLLRNCNRAVLRPSRRQRVDGDRNRQPQHGQQSQDFFTVIT